MEIRYPEKSGSKLLYSILKMLPQCLGSLPKYNFNLSVGHRTEITYACIQLWPYKIGFVIINCVILTIYTIFGKLSYWIKNLCFSKKPILLLTRASGFDSWIGRIYNQHIASVIPCSNVKKLLVQLHSSRQRNKVFWKTQVPGII